MMLLAFSGLDPSQAFLFMNDLVVIGFSEKNMFKNLTTILNFVENTTLS